jgi:hypothetical protein
MTRDDIIKIARQSGVLSGYESELFQRFAKLVAAAEREACARIADEVGDDDEDCHAWVAADAIRARGEE